jgi:hypothetical protein
MVWFTGVSTFWFISVLDLGQRFGLTPVVVDPGLIRCA